MADSQNPVYTDNVTILGDGTEEHPLTSSATPGTLADNASVRGTTGTTGLTNGTEAVVGTFEFPDRAAAPVGFTWAALLWGAFSLLFTTPATATAAVVRLYRGTDATGTLIATFTLTIDNTGPIITEMPVSVHFYDTPSPLTADSYAMTVELTGSDGTATAASFSGLVAQVPAGF